MTNPVLQSENKEAEAIIRINGREISKEVTIVQVAIFNDCNKVPFAKLKILDGDPGKENFEESEKELFLPGEKIEIIFGTHLLFEGVISRHAIESRRYKVSTLSLDCRGEIFQMTKNKRFHQYSQVSDDQIIRDLFSKYSLSLKLGASSNLQHESLVQMGASDWDFLMMRLEALGWVLLPGEKSVRIEDFTSLGKTKPNYTLIYGQNILEMNIELNQERQYKKIETKSWDSQKQKPLIEEGEGATPPAQGNVSMKDLISSNGSLEKKEFTHSPLEKEELQYWAAGMHARHSWAKIKGWIKIQGSSKIRVGDIVHLQGLGDRFNGDAFVSGVRHELSAGQWISDIQFGFNDNPFWEKAEVGSPSASGLLPSTDGLHLGVVKKIEEDPKGWGRTLVMLPAIEDHKGIWVRQSLPYAGKEYGFVFTPEEGDEVVLGFLNNDPRFPILLGGLYNSKNKPPFGAGDKHHEKGVRTKAGLALLLDEKEKSISLSTKQGLKIAINESKNEIVISDKGENEVIFDRKGISFKSDKDIHLKAKGQIKLEGTSGKGSFKDSLKLDATSIENIAKNKFKAKGGGSVEVSSTGISVLKGSLVKIN